MTATDTNTSDPRSTTKRLTITINPVNDPPVFRGADVNDDGNVTPLDALLILNQISRARGDCRGVVELLVERTPQMYYDTGGDYNHTISRIILICHQSHNERCSRDVPENVMSTTELPKSIPFQPVRLSVQRYHELTRAGAFTGHDAVELLDGVVVEKMSKNPPQRLATRKCDLVLSQLCPGGWHVQNQEPITLQNSEPEPDIAMVRGRLEDYADRHPTHYEVGLVVEVADTTLVTDRYKAELYALAGIPVYWLINLVDGCIEVMTQPQVVSGQSGYAHCKLYQPADRLELVVDGKQVGSTPVTDLLR